MGHSYGGLTVARATERYPGKIHVAVYIASVMLSSDQAYSDIHMEVKLTWLNYWTSVRIFLSVHQGALQFVT